MKHLKRTSPLLLIFLCLPLFFRGAAAVFGQEASEPEKEFVEVSNAEILLRVTRDGKPVKGLSAENFSLTENGTPRPITSCIEISRKIISREDIAIEGDQSDSLLNRPRRLFFLYFLFNEPDPLLDKSLDYFFANAFAEGDYVLAICGRKLFKFTKLDEVPRFLPELKAAIRAAADNGLREKERLSATMDRLFRDFDTRIHELSRRNSPHQQKSVRTDLVKNLLDQLAVNYKTLWDEYTFKRSSLTPEALLQLATSLKPVQFEKWGLVFFQSETFPRLNPESLFAENRDDIDSFVEIQRRFQSVSNEMTRPAPNNLLERLKNTFVDSGATFHMIHSVPESFGQLESQYLKREKIYSLNENIFTQLAQITGGMIINTGKIDEAIPRALLSEDIHYRITYPPLLIPEKERQVAIACVNKKNVLAYNPAVLIRKANEMTLDSARFNFPVLEFSLSHYQQLFDGEKLNGDIRIRVAAIDANGDMLDFSRDFKPEDPAFSASMTLQFPKGGRYTLIMEALDIQTGKKVTFSEKADIPETALNQTALILEKQQAPAEMEDPLLGAVLKKAAAYCERLQQTTFYFTCTEKINDYYGEGDREIKNDLYTHDYQIVMEENGDMTETRTPPGQKSPSHPNKPKKKHRGERDEYFVLTNFYSQYPFLLPANLLARENRKKYSYQLLAKEKEGGVDAWKIAVTPKTENTELNRGVVWVDPRDGSILKVSLDPRSLKGYQTLESRAVQKERRIKLSDTHWYAVLKNQVRFPSRTEISEKQYDAAQEITEQTAPQEYTYTHFSYENYRFFSVNSDVVKSHHE